MIKLLFLFFVPFSLYAFEVPLIRVSIDKTTYHPLEKSLLVAEVNVSPANAEYEFILDANINGSGEVLEANSDYVWSALSTPLHQPGLNTWNVKLYFIKKTFSRPIRDAIHAKKLALQDETDPSQRANLESDISQLDSELDGLKRFVKTTSVEFEVINSAPQASFVSPANVQVATDFNLDASNSLDIDGSIVRYDWELGDGHVINNGGSILTHSYDTTGTYTVTLKVVDNFGAENTFSAQIHVQGFTCEEKDDYSFSECSGTFVATSMEDLFRYSMNYGVQAGKYKDLKIAFSLNQASTVEVHSPCKIYVEANQVLKAANLCLDGRRGVSQSEMFGVDVAENAYILSELGNIAIPMNASLRAKNLSLKSSSLTQINTNALLQISQNLHVEGSNCSVSGGAQIHSGSTSGNCLQ